MPTSLPGPEPSTVALIARRYGGSGLFLLAIILLRLGLHRAAHAVARAAERIGGC
jgi:hypothetical protein